eukprot:GSChrysophyteH1.ASY1.ANO1.913.1 assembled CDS
MSSQEMQPLSRNSVPYQSVPFVDSITEEEKELLELQKGKAEKIEDPSLKYFNTIVGAFLVYLLFSSVVYWYMEDLEYGDAFYLSLITFTTIGYGDISPTRDSTKIFTCIFVFVNLLLVGQLLDYVVDTVVEQRRQDQQEFLENVFDSETKESDSERHSHWISKEYMALYEALGTAVSMIGGTIFVGTLFFSLIVDDHTVIDSIYLSCMSISTVGYGDVVPTNKWSKAFGCVYAVVGTVTFGSAVSGFVGSVSEFRLLAKNEKALSNSVLDYETFLKADADGSDSVSKEEFVLFRLQQMGVIPENLKERAEQQFDRMDADGSGDLTMEDIILHQNSHHTEEHQQQLILKYRALKKEREHKQKLEEMRKDALEGRHANPDGSTVFIGNRRGSTGIVNEGSHAKLASVNTKFKQSV